MPDWHVRSIARFRRFSEITRRTSIRAGGRDIGPLCVAQYRDLLPHGSYLAVSHARDDQVPQGIDQTLADIKTTYDTNGSPVIWRDQHVVAELLGDFALVDPGVVWTPAWHPECASADIEPIEFTDPARRSSGSGSVVNPDPTSFRRGRLNDDVSKESLASLVCMLSTAA